MFRRFSAGSCFLSIRQISMFPLIFDFERDPVLCSTPDFLVSFSLSPTHTFYVLYWNFYRTKFYERHLSLPFRKTQRVNGNDYSFLDFSTAYCLYSIFTFNLFFFPFLRFFFFFLVVCLIVLLRWDSIYSIGAYSWTSWWLYWCIWTVVIL